MSGALPSYVLQSRWEVPVAYFSPLLELGVIPEDLHGGFSVRVVGRLEAELSDTDFLEKRFNGSNKVPQREVSICYEAFDLVEFA